MRQKILLKNRKIYVGNNKKQLNEVSLSVFFIYDFTIDFDDATDKNATNFL